MTNSVYLTTIFNWNIYRASKICGSHHDRPLTALSSLDNKLFCNMAFSRTFKTIFMRLKKFFSALFTFLN